MVYFEDEKSTLNGNFKRFGISLLNQLYNIRPRKKRDFFLNLSTAASFF
jgi:hypothetical protein